MTLSEAAGRDPAVILRVLRRTSVAQNGDAELLARLVGDVRPSGQELAAALLLAYALPDADPAKARIVSLLRQALATPSLAEA